MLKCNTVFVKSTAYHVPTQELRAQQITGAKFMFVSVTSIFLEVSYANENSQVLKTVCFNLNSVLEYTAEGVINETFQTSTTSGFVHNHAMHSVDLGELRKA